MKRRREDGAGGGTAKKMPSGARFAMKLLFSPEEVHAINGQDESGFGEIQQITGADLVTNGGFYPGTELLEIAFTGASVEDVSAALVESMTSILRSDLGAMTNNEEVRSSDDARLKAVLPTKAAAAVIGKGGETIKELRAMTGCKFHVDTNSIPPGGGEAAEQIVALSGTLDGIQLAIPKIVQFVADFTEEPWFAAWAVSSNAGLHIPGLRVEFTGKGAKDKGKGKGSFDSVAPAIGSMSGEVCQFFAKAGWCKYGDACKHSHSTADIALVEALNAEGPLAAPPPSGEPCLFYQKTGWCKYGDACRHSHAGAPPASALPCSFFAREGWCKFGDACRNSHQLASSSTAPVAAPRAAYAEVASVSGEICQFFAKAGWCKYGDACKHAHVSNDPVLAPAPAPAPVSGAPPNSSGEMCQFFVKAGWCKYGDACRHSHGEGIAPLGPAVAPIVGGSPTNYGTHGPKQLPPAVAALAPAPALPPEPLGEVCQFFAKAGWCKYGDACRYAHLDPQEQANPHASALVSTAMNLLRQTPNGIPSTAAPRGPPQSGEICQFFVKAGWCKYGDACKHSHVVEQPMEMMAPPASQGVSGEICQFFAKAGWCKYGEACKHSHDTGVLLEPAAPVARVNSRPSSQEICQFFAKAGWCKFGDACKHIHERVEEVAPGRPPGGLSLPPASSGEICQFFARAGWCKYGDACKHEHVHAGATNGNLMDLGSP